jgi:hypothetical protein
MFTGFVQLLHCGRPSKPPASMRACAGKRKSLARALSTLFQLPLQLLPFYARITATLSQHFPQIGDTVAAAVLRSVKGTTKSKDPTARTLEPRVRAARYLCELAKFRVIDTGAHAVREVALCAPSHLPRNR